MLVLSADHEIRNIKKFQEAINAGKALGIAEYQTLDNHDGELLPSLQVRHQVIRAIRKWNADIVLGHRPNDYHPDHRNAGKVVVDASYMVIVPNVCPDTPPLSKNPLFLYMEDNFTKPYPHEPDIVVSIDNIIELKIDGLHAHTSQIYEWLPWTNGGDEILAKIPTTNKVPTDTRSVAGRGEPFRAHKAKGKHGAKSIIAGTPKTIIKKEPVSYTHLTLPTKA